MHIPSKLKTMTIRRRLAVSNILMLLLPIAIVFFIALLSIAIIFHIVITSDESAFDAFEAFLGDDGLEGLVSSISHSEYAAALRLTLDMNSMHLFIMRNGDLIFSHGTVNDNEKILIDVASILDYNGSATKDGRTLLVNEVVNDNDIYRIFVFAGSNFPSDRALRIAAIIVLCLIVITAVLSIFLTNRFLTRFVFKRIEAPLDILSKGVEEIGSGNLSYRIKYSENDEFLPICNEFNNMAEKLHEAITNTQREEKSRKELFAGLSHDIRSPLTSIQAYVEGLIDGIADTPEKESRYLRTIKAKAEDIERMVSSVFLFTELDMDNFPVDFIDSYLDEEVMEFVRVNGPSFQDRGLLIQTGTLDHAKVSYDKVMISRLLMNITENSVKYKDKAEAHLVISIKKTKENILLIMEDDGPGVPEEDIDRLFDVFYRGDRARRNPAEGSGLGLAIVKRVMTRMGGSITAENKVQGGLKITAAFPEGGKNAEDTDNRR